MRSNRFGWALALLVASGCSEESGVGPGAGGSGGAEEAPPDPYAHLYDCSEVAFDEVHAFSGPGYDPAIGIIGTPQETYVVSTSVLYWWEEATTDLYQNGAKIIAQMDASPGMVAFAAGTDDTCRAARQLSVWRSEEDLYAFVLSGAHGEVIGKTEAISSTARTIHWTVTADELASLTWDLARAKLEDVERHPIYASE